MSLILAKTKIEIEEKFNLTITINFESRAGQLWHSAAERICWAALRPPWWIKRMMMMIIFTSHQSLTAMFCMICQYSCTCIFCFFTSALFSTLEQVDMIKELHYCWYSYDSLGRPSEDELAMFFSCSPLTKSAKLHFKNIFKSIFLERFKEPFHIKIKKIKTT